MKPSLLLLSLLALFAAGCSKEARRENALAAAEAHYQAQEYDKAEVEFLNVLKADPSNARAISRLGLIYAEQGRGGMAIAYIRRAHELLPDDQEIRIKLMQMNLAGGKLAEVRQEAESLLSKQPGNPEVPILLSAAVSRPEEIEPARAILDGLPEAVARTAPVLTARGILEMRQGRLAEAETFFKDAVAADSKYAEAHAAMGTLLLAKRDPQAAAASLKQAAELSPPRSTRRLMYARVKSALGETAESRRILEEMTKATPDFIPAWLALAELDLAEQKHEECAAHVERALAQDPQNLDAKLLQLRLRIARKEYDRAVEESERLVTAAPALAPAHFELARALAGRGDGPRALSALRQTLALAPDHPDAALLLASMSVVNRDYSTAVVLMRRLIEQRPFLLQAYLVLGEAHRGQGDLEQALAAFRRAEQLFPKNTQTPLLIGQILARQGKIEESRTYLTRARSAQPDNAAILEQFVNLDIAAKDFKGARSRIEEAVAANPAWAGVGQLLLAKVYLAENDRSAAETAAKRAVELMPDNMTAYMLLAGIYNSTNQAERALESLKEAAIRNPRDSNALTLIGMLSQQRQDPAGARDAYEKLLIVNPKAPIGLNNLAYLFIENFNDPDKALELAQRAHEVAPSDPNIADTLGWALFQKRQYSRALAHLQEAASKIPDSPEVLYHLGMAHYMLGDEGPAREILQRSVAGNANHPGVARARQALELLALEGQEERSRDALDKALARQPDDPVALLRLAHIHEREGDYDRALQRLAEARQTSDRNVGVALASARVHTAKKEGPRALQFARTARQLAPDDGSVALAVGRIAFDLGDYEWAAGALLDAARKLPPTPELSFDVARAEYSVGRVEEALTRMRSVLSSRGTFLREADARQFVELLTLASTPAPAAQQIDSLKELLTAEPRNVPALMALAVALEHTTNSAGARDTYEKVLAIYPGFTPAKARVAVIAASQGEDDTKAFEWALQARALYPRDAELAKALGILSYRKGEYARAVPLLQQGTAARDEDAEAHFYLGLARSRTRDHAGTRTALERALQLGLAPTSAAEAKQALEALR